MVEAPAAPPPVFCVTTVTLIVSPAPAEVGTVNVGTCTSGPMRTVRLATLLASFTSATASPPSAREKRYHVPVAVPAGMVTAREPESEAPEASAGTARVPSSMSEASSVALAER